MTEPMRTLDRDYLTVKQAAEYLNVKPQTIQQWIHRGKIQSVQAVPRGKHLISAAMIERMLRR